MWCTVTANSHIYWVARSNISREGTAGNLGKGRERRDRGHAESCDMCLIMPTIRCSLFDIQMNRHKWDDRKLANEFLRKNVVANLLLQLQSAKATRTMAISNR